MITDAQVHIYEPDTPQRPWPKEEGRVPATIPSYSAERMIGAMQAVGVDRAVIVPPSWQGDQNDVALAAAAKYPDRFAVMGRLDPFEGDVAARVEHWRETPGLLGVRMNARWSSRPEPVIALLMSGELDFFFALCAQHEVPVMFLPGGRHGDLASGRSAFGALERIATEIPNLRLIIDHLGTIEGPTAAESFALLDDLLALARHNNVNVKVSTAPNRSREPFPFADVHPYLRRMYDAYGSRRMMWAADITQLTKNTYAECLRLWQEGLPFLSDGDREWILGRTVAEVLRWPED